MPDADPPRSKPTALIIASACTLACAVLTVPREGLGPKPGAVYLDPAKIATQCYGETRNVDWTRIYSKDECAAKLRARMAADYAPKIAQCLPTVVNERRVHVLAALLDAAYNAGPVAVCKSRMADSIRAGNWRAGCDGFHGWFTTARDRKTGARVALRGLVLRRDAEAAMCLKDVA